MEKVIHYCWFGGKALPKMAEKCIKSWKKFLPDFEIKEWNETNTNLEECPFVKGAYETKKWAFVADYIRTKVLKDYGGIYFDVDMEITKNVEHLFKEDTNVFLGIEDTGYVAVGVWYEKEKNGILPTKLLEVYQSMKEFDPEKMSDISIPKLISEILNEYGLKNGSNEVQELEHGITIYPREYFYPYSYDWEEKVFTDNTCMIHYYDASWVPLRARIETWMVRRLGKNITYKIINLIRLVKRIIVKILKLVLFPLVIYRRYKRSRANITAEYKENIEKVKKDIEDKNYEYIVFYNDEWIGPTSSTIELFDNLIPCREVYRKKEAQEIAQTILKTNAKQVIFSSFAEGWKDIAIYLKKYNPKIKVKTFWHGSHSQILDIYGWSRNQEIVELHKTGIVDAMATCKESLLEFYKKQGYNAVFLTNKVELDFDIEKTKKIDDGKIRIGLYAAKCTDWRKNMYSQMAAVSLIDNAILDIAPLDEKAESYAKILGLEITGKKGHLPRKELIQRMARK